MNNHKIFIMINFITLSIVSTHSMANDVAVYATQQSQGSVAILDKAFYTKKFEVAIVNLSDKDVDLSSRCLSAYTPEGKLFKLDTVDETLVIGKLEPMKMATGFAVFSSEDDSVYRASMIKANDSCK